MLPHFFKFKIIHAIALILIIGTAGCGKKENEIVYKARGVVTEWGKQGESAFIHHEKIEGFMEEMTMLLKSASTNEFRGVKPGDQITFELVLNQEAGTFIRKIQKTGRHFPEQIRDQEKSLAAIWQGSELNPGDEVPAFALTNHQNKPKTNESYLGNPWIVTFIFTRCPLPDFCPKMTSQFEKLALMIPDELDSKIHLVSITMDPKFDNPAQLSRYAATIQSHSAKWDFLTGDLEEIKKLGDPLGLDFSTDTEPISHNLRTAIFDGNGHLVSVFSGNQWTVEDLVDSLKSIPNE